MILKPNTGIDISDYQPGLQIGSLSPLPRFVIIKATENILYKAKLTADFSAQCKALGIPYGFYHFWQNTDPFKQASNYIAQVNAAGGFERIPPVLDLEVANLAPYSSNIKTWLDVVEDVAGMRPILYSNKYHFDMIAANSWFKNYDVWTAAYPTDPDLWSWCPPLYSEKRARREIIWQYGSTYRYPNYSANSVDTNIAITEWLNEIGAITQPPPPPTGETMSNKGTVIKTVRIRNADNTDAGGLLYAGDIVYGEVKLAYGLNRIFYNHIYRKAGNVQTWVGNSALIDGGVTLITTQAGFTDPAEVVTPPAPAPVGDIQFNATLKADGTITGTWTEI